MFSFRNGITVKGFSADGDCRLLSCMSHHTELNTAASNFAQSELKDFLCLQDTIHIGTKLRNCLLVASICLALGSKLISLSHLKLLINNVPKEEHGIVMKDICVDDRQNFGSLEKVMRQRTLDSLSKHVPGCNGTVMFLKICAEVTSSLIEEDLSPEDRIYRIWHGTFFLRAWRKWMKKTSYKLTDNFISRNAYVCIEINATNLLALTRKFREQNIEKYFMPSLFNSQPCEEIFRQFRSMGTINFTKINFTLLELFHLVGRVELQNDIVYIKLADKDITFPRNKINNAQLNKYKLPSDTEMLNVITL